MALKAILKSVEGLSEELKKLYVKKGDEYRLDVEDLPEDPKLAEFRDNNRKLNKELSDAKEELKKFDGIDATKYKEYESTQQKLKDGELIKAGKIDELLNSKIEPIKKEFQSKLEESEKKNATLASQLEVLQVDNKLTEIGTKKGLRPTAIQDMLGRGRSVFKLKDGKVVALDQDGAQRRAKSGDPLSMEAWFDEDLTPNAPHLFQSSNGGGANGNNGHNGNSKTMSRAEFDKLPPLAQREFITTTKGTVTD
jgi:hypothetical protein